eukprot:m.156582 g.156582  ORF g.156582 m.156582 type:complete len:316 (+) comp52930_c0_seq14:278-1225(+)
MVLPQDFFDPAPTHLPALHVTVDHSRRRKQAAPLRALDASHLPLDEIRPLVFTSVWQQVGAEIVPSPAEASQPARSASAIASTTRVHKIRRAAAQHKHYAFSKLAFDDDVFDVEVRLACCRAFLMRPATDRRLGFSSSSPPQRKAAPTTEMMMLPAFAWPSSTSLQWSSPSLLASAHPSQSLLRFPSRSPPSLAPSAPEKSAGAAARPSTNPGLLSARYQCAHRRLFCSTPLWRDIGKEAPLCNACGIRYKKYGLVCDSCFYVPCKSERAKGVCPRCTAVFPEPVNCRFPLKGRSVDSAEESDELSEDAFSPFDL